MPSNSQRSDPDSPILAASRYATILLGSFRTGHAGDPEVYARAIIAVLSRYPVEVMRTVTDPVNGLPSKIDFVPTIAELKAACEEVDGPRRRAEQRERSIRGQLDQREELAITDGRPRKTYEEIKADLAEVGIFIGGEGSRYVRSVETPKSVMGKYGLTQAQWDAIETRKLKPGESGPVKLGDIPRGRGE